jgi:hypothetical protein
MPASFGAENAAPASFLNNNMNKGKWTQDKDKIFMQECEKYGKNCMQIAKVLSTQTPTQFKSMLNVSSKKIRKQILQQSNNIESPSLPMGKHKS